MTPAPGVTWGFRVELLAIVVMLFTGTYSGSVLMPLRYYGTGAGMAPLDPWGHSSNEGKSTGVLAPHHKGLENSNIGRRASGSTYSLMLNTTLVGEGEITIDGSLDDWPQSKPSIEDTSDPFPMGGGVDIKALYTAHTSSALYLGVRYTSSLKGNDTVPYLSVLLSAIDPSMANTALKQRPRSYGNATLGTDLTAFEYMWELMALANTSRMRLVNATPDGSIRLLATDMIASATDTTMEMCLTLKEFAGIDLLNSTLLIALTAGVYKNTSMVDTDSIPDDFHNICLQYPSYKSVEFISLPPQYNTVIPDGSFLEWRDIKPSASLGNPSEPEGTDGDIRISHNIAYLNLGLNTSVMNGKAGWGFFVAVSLDLEVTDTIYHLPFFSPMGNGTRVRYDTLFLWTSVDPKRVSIYRHGVSGDAWGIDPSMFYSTPDVMGVGDGFIELRIPISQDGLGAELGQKTGLITGTLYIPENTGPRDMSSFIISSIYPSQPIYHQAIYTLSKPPMDPHGVRLTPHIKTISIDGNLDDWSGIPEAWSDPNDYGQWYTDSNGNGAVDIFGHEVDPRALDIKDVYICHDTNFLYLGVRFYGDLERYGTSQRVAFEIDIETPPNASLFNHTPRPDYVNGYPYRYMGVIRDDQAMVTTSNYGFNISTVCYWLSQAFDHINPTNHDSYYYFNSSSAYWYYSASTDLTTCVSGNVLEMKIPLFDHGFYAKVNHVLRFSLTSDIWSVPFMYPIDMAPYNDTYGIPLYFEYPLTIEPELWASSVSKDYIKKLDFAFSNLLDLDYGNFTQEYNEYSALRNEFMTGGGDVLTLSSALEGLYEGVESKYTVSTVQHLAKLLSYVYGRDEMSEVYGLITHAWREWNASAYTSAKELCERAMDMMGDMLPEIKVAIYDSGGTNHVSNRDWPGIIANLTHYTWLNVSIDYKSLNKENITYEDLITTGCDVVVIDDAKNRASGELLTPLETNELERFVSEGHGLVGLGYTLAATTYPEHEALAELFGLDPSTRPLSEIRSPPGYIFLEPGSDMFMGMAITGFVSGTPNTIAPIGIKNDEGARAIATGGNVSYIIDRSVDEWHSLYFTSPILTIRKDNPMWQPSNGDNYRMFFNAIATVSGVYEVAEAIATLNILLDENRDKIDATAAEAGIKDAQALYKDGRFAEAKGAIYNALRSYLHAVLDDLVSLMDNKLTQLYSIDPIKYSGPIEQYSTIKAEYNISETSYALYTVYMALNNLSTEVNEVFDVELQGVILNLTDLSHTVDNISALGYDLTDLSVYISEGIEQAHTGDLEVAKAHEVDAKEEIYRLYQEERERLKTLISVAQRNLFSRTTGAEETLQKADRAADEGDYYTAFKTLKNAEESINEGYPPHIVLGLIATTMVLAFLVAMIAVQRRTEVQYIGQIMDEVLKNKTHRNALFIASPLSHASEFIMAHALTYRNKKAFFIYDHATELEERLRSRPRYVISSKIKGTGIHHPSECDGAGMLVAVSHEYTKAGCDMIVCALKQEFREVKGGDIQKAALIQYLINMGRKKHIPVFVYLSDDMLPDHAITQLVKASSNAYSIDHIGAKGGLHFFRTRHLYDYFTHRRHGTWDKIAQLKRNGKSIERKWYILGHGGK